jgi:hypothetical protein
MRFCTSQIRSNALPDRVFWELDSFAPGSGVPMVESTDLKLGNATSISQGAYTLYTISKPVQTRLENGNFAAIIGGKTYRTPWGSIFDLVPWCNP